MNIVRGEKFKPHSSRFVPFEEQEDSAGNVYWKVEGQWLLVFGPLHLMCENTFGRLALELNPPGMPMRARVDGLGYRRVVFQQSEAVPRRVGFAEIER
jgi:hypothetical protein